MAASTVWWVLTGALVAAELSTGTFYLLMVALGTATGALAAHLGLAPTQQVLCAALVGSLCTGLYYIRRRRQAEVAPPPEANPDVNLDIGQVVLVEAWDDQGLTRVHYRGAQWAAHFAGTGQASPGPHRIAALRGSVLVLHPL